MRRRNLLIALLITTSLLLLPQPTVKEVLANEASKTVVAIPTVKSVAEDTPISPEPSDRETTAPATQPQPILEDEPDAISLEVTPAELKEITEPETLASTEPDEHFDFGNQWALGKIGVSELWDTSTGNEVLVAILDTGIDDEHQELAGQVSAEVDFTNSSSPSDRHGHGTHVAGIIAAKRDGTDVTGIAYDCSLLNVKIADDTGSCRMTALIEGINWAVDSGASVINISIEFREPSPELAEAINYAWSQGSLVVAAAGNNGDGTSVYPACYDHCLAVAATTQNDELAPLSNHSDWVDVAAPGFSIYSTVPDNGYSYKSGTSFACAYVSGLAALLFDIMTDNNGDGKLNDEVRAAIEGGCEEISARGVGGGRIDAVKTTAQILTAP
jgi:thermitase